MEPRQVVGDKQDAFVGGVFTGYDHEVMPMVLGAEGGFSFGASDRVSVDAIEEVVRRCGTRICTANAGDVWLYSTPILHASEAAIDPMHRRVLQLDFAAEELRGGLKWLGV